MDDETALSVLAERLRDYVAALRCPICHYDEWRVEVSRSPSDGQFLSERDFSREGDITRTCGECGYRQHFAAVPMK